MAECGGVPSGKSMATKLGALIVAAVRLRIPDLSLLGFFGGFFAVPLNAMIQHRPRQEQKGGVIAVANLLSFVGVFLAAGAYYLLSDGFRQTPAGVFLDGAILTLVTTTVSIYLLARFPAAFRPQIVTTQDRITAIPCFLIPFARTLQPFATKFSPFERFSLLQSAVCVNCHPRRNPAC